jgi:molybdopterin-guanine dinucleotide biosynthesis protein A
MYKRRTITGAIVAGGKSSRMGRDKALLDLNGKPFIQHVAEALLEVFQTVILVADHGERYRFLNLPIYKDIFKQSGPLAGIHSALSHTKARAVFIASCDVPFLTPAIIRYVIRPEVRNDVTLLAGGNSLQPLCGLYTRNCLPTIENHLRRGQYSVLQCLHDLKTTILSPSFICEASAPHPLTNVNTPDDYKRCLREVTARSFL